MDRHKLTYPIAIPADHESLCTIFNNERGLLPCPPSMLQSVTRGCRLLHWSQEFNEPVKLPVVHSRAFLALCFNLGDTIYYNINGIRPGKFRKHQYNLVYIPDGELDFHTGMYTTLSIQLTPRFLNTYAETFSLNDFLQKVAHQEPAVACAGHLSITPFMKKSISQILMNRYTGQYRNHFINTCSMHMLFECFRYIQDYGRPYNAQLAYNPQPDIQYAKKIKEAFDFLRNNLKEQIVIADLESITGLNKAKLEKGFKLMYGATIFTVLFEERMKRAKALLRDSTMTICQIAYEVGFKNLSNFSESFKRRFSYPPSAWREGALEEKRKGKEA